MLIEIHILSWNEEVLLPYTVMFYRSRLGYDVPIIIHDNQSTDSTTSLARSYGCNVKTFTSRNKFNDAVHQRIRNTCWKKSKAKWILVIDMDEWLDITPEFLDQCENTNINLITGKGYDMVSKNDTTALNTVVRGVPNKLENKPLLFYRSAFADLNFIPGGHAANPVLNNGFLKVKKNRVRPYIYHMKYFSLEYIESRYAAYNLRMSRLNKKNKWGAQYWETSVSNTFKALRKKCKIVNQNYKKCLFEIQ